MTVVHADLGGGWHIAMLAASKLMLVFGWVLPTVGVLAQDAPPPRVRPTAAIELLSSTSVERGLSPRDGEVALHSRPVSLDIERLRSAQATGSRLTFHLQEHLVVTGIVTNVDVSALERFTLAGRLEAIPGGQFTLAVRGQTGAGVIRVPGRGVFMLGTAPTGEQVLSEVDESRYDPCGVNDDGQSVTELSALAAGIGSRDRLVLEPASRALVDDGSLIDVLVVYTSAARSGAGGTTAMEALIDLAIANTNQSFANSAISPRVRLVHSAELVYTESGQGGVDLARLRAVGDGFLDDAHALRDLHGADLVCMITENMAGFCGLAYVMNEESAEFASSAFSVVRRSCASSFPFPHELAHNLGCQHDRVNAGGCGFGYAYGYREPGSALFRTVMSYAPGTPIPYFSNPMLLYDGLPIGAGIDTVNPTCNTCTINAVALTAANWRASQAAPLPMTDSEGLQEPSYRIGGPVLFVDAGATGAGDGSSWQNAFADLQDALVLARDAGGTVSEIWVARGVYRPDRGSGDRYASFRLVDGVGVYGGFAGGETARDHRDHRAQPTVLSGDLEQDDAAGGDTYENSAHVIEAAEVGPQAVLDGFTISGGYNLNLSWAYDGGGGLLVRNAGPTIRHCRFADNQGIRGGAMLNLGGSPRITECTFQRNRGGPLGGAIYTRSGSLELIGCVVTGNSTTDCEVVTTGAGLYSDGSETTVLNCTFYGNVSQLGRAVAGDDGLTVISSILWEDETLIQEKVLAAILGGAPTVNHSCVRGWTGQWEGKGNHGSNPLLVDGLGVEGVAGTDDDDLHLTPLSPCIDAGSLDHLPPPGVADLDGQDRVRNCRVDIGADEAAYFADCDANGEPDGCEMVSGAAANCDENGLLDRCEVISVSRLLVVGRSSANVVSFDGSGQPVGELVPAASGDLIEPVDIAVDTARLVYVADRAAGRIRCYRGATGAFIREYTAASWSRPSAVAISGPGIMLVADEASDSVAKLDLATGSDLGVLVIPGSGGLDEPAAMAISPKGLLLIASRASNQVLAYDLKTGDFLAVAAQGGSLLEPAGLNFDYQGNLLVSSAGTHAILRYSDEGGYLGEFVPAGSANLWRPGKINRNFIGNLLVCSETTGRIFAFSASAGAPLDRDYTQPGPQAVFLSGGGVQGPVACAALVGNECDRNGIPDACQIADGSSTDCNENKVPDNCEGDSDGDGTINACDDDADGDTILDDGDGSHIAGDHPCTAGATQNCDDNCRFTPNADQADSNGDGVGDACTAKFLYVDTTAGGANDGSSWTDAYVDLQEALEAVWTGMQSAREIWVARGVYRPDRLTGDRGASFRFVNGLGVYGGFAGGETQRTQRKPLVHATILSGDLLGNDDDTGDISDNAWHVVIADGLSAGTVIDGFTITGGNADGDEPDNSGGGVYAAYGSPALVNCRFVGNRAARDGGAVFCTLYSEPTLVNCALAGNVAGRAGGGIYCENYSRATLVNCALVSNTATGGAGMTAMLGSHCTLTNCTVSGNMASGLCGGFLNVGANPTVVNSILWGNTYHSSPVRLGQFHHFWGEPVVRYSCVQDESAGDGDIYPGTGNLDRDPRFVGQSAARSAVVFDPNSWWLRPDSPVIDAGDTAALPVDTFDLDGDERTNETIATDLDGHRRRVDSPMTVDTGVGPPPIVDMGAFEYQPDCNGNGITDECDISCGPAGGACDQPGCGGSSDCDLNDMPDDCQADVDGDGVPDVCEFRYADYDLDGDVDLSDFGLFQECLSGRNIPPATPACTRADLDRDRDVDNNDLYYFLLCARGADVPADPHCLD